MAAPILLVCLYPPSMPIAGWVYIMGQAALAGVSLWLLARFVWPRLSEPPHPDGTRDVWGPVVLIAPLLFFARAPEWSVSSGDMTVALPIPIIAGALGLSLALFRLNAPPGATPLPLRLLVVAAGVGLLLILLGWAHELHMLIGQSAFAIAALLLWMNSPASPHSAAAGVARHDPPGVLGILAIAIAHGWLASRSTDGWRDAGGWMLGLWVITALALAGWRASPRAAIPLALWTASIGGLLVLGSLSLRLLIPHLYSRVASPTGESSVSMRAAFGFGAYATEAILLLALPIAVAAAMRCGPVLRRVVALMILAAAVTASIWRGLNL